MKDRVAHVEQVIRDHYRLFLSIETAGKAGDEKAEATVDEEKVEKGDPAAMIGELVVPKNRAAMQKHRRAEKIKIIRMRGINQSYYM